MGFFDNAFKPRRQKNDGTRNDSPVDVVGKTRELRPATGKPEESVAFSEACTSWLPANATKTDATFATRAYVPPFPQGETRPISGAGFRPVEGIPPSDCAECRITIAGMGAIPQPESKAILIGSDEKCDLRLSGLPSLAATIIFNSEGDILFVPLHDSIASCVDQSANKLEEINCGEGAVLSDGDVIRLCGYTLALDQGPESWEFSSENDDELE